MPSARGLREQRVEHFADHALARTRQLADALKLLLNLWCRSAFGGLGARAHQFLDADPERLSDDRQRRDLNAAAADFVGGDGLL